MTLGDGFLLAVRWLHALAAAAWIGGSLLYLLVLRPALRKANPGADWINRLAATEFRGLTDTSIFVLVITGTIIAFHRLTEGFISVAYVGTLAVKVVLGFWMFYLVWSQRRRSITANLAHVEQSHNVLSRWRKLTRGVSGYKAILILGVIVYLLSDVLKVLFEKALVGN